MKNKNIISRNDKGQAHGYWEYYWYGNLFRKCVYINGQRNGFDELYDFDGIIAEKNYYL